MGYYKKASVGKTFYRLNEENELLGATEISTPDINELDKWQEFDNEEQAKTHFGTENE